MTEAAQNGLPAVLPLRDILEDSLFYPASGFDGTPVKLLVGNVVSFVYADYGFGDGEKLHENFLRELAGEGHTGGFLGYSRIAGRDVDPAEFGHEGWAPPAQPRPPHPCHDWGSRAFAHWSIWKRDENRDHTHGPLLFSFLFLGWEALAAYQATYIDKDAPKIIAIISPGDGFGGGWTPLTD